MENHRKTLLHLIKERAYKHGQFTLSSGKESEHYINCKPVTLSCEGNALCSHLMIEHVEDESKAVGGLTLGADPLVCGIAQKAYYSGKHIDALIALLPVVVTSSNTVTTDPLGGLFPSITSFVPYPFGFFLTISASMCLPE